MRERHLAAGHPAAWQPVYRFLPWEDRRDGESALLRDRIRPALDAWIILWRGRCEVHERFRAEDLRDYRTSWPGVQIYAHPECPPDVLAEADYVGSTAGLLRHVDAVRPERVVLVTECSMSDNVAVAHPEVECIRPCNLCPHMKRITLPKILASLERMEHEVTIDPAVAGRARRAVERMLEVGRGAGG